MKAGTDSCKLSLKATKENKEDKELTLNVAAAKDSIDAAVGAVLSEQDGIFILKEEARTALGAFLGGQRVFI